MTNFGLQRFNKNFKSSACGSSNKTTDGRAFRKTRRSPEAHRKSK